MKCKSTRDILRMSQSRAFRHDENSWMKMLCTKNLQKSPKPFSRLFAHFRVFFIFRLCLTEQMIAAARLGSLPHVKKFLEQGVDVNLVSEVCSICFPSKNRQRQHLCPSFSNLFCAHCLCFGFLWSSNSRESHLS